MSQRSLARWAMPLTALAMSAGLVTISHAHGPTRQRVVEKITIDAPADAVWAKIKNFDSIKDWHPAVADSPADKGNTEGSVRTLKLKGGGTLVETLEGYSDAQKKYN